MVRLTLFRIPLNDAISFISLAEITIPINAQIGIKRATNSGSWGTASTLSANTEIARMVSQFRYSGSDVWRTNTVTWVFTLKDELVIPAYTCSITQYDKNVTLPEVKRSDIVSHGAGRYLNAKKEFKFNLVRDPQTTVSVTFEGTPLSGTDNVLKNTLTGNDNIGVQMLFSDDTPVKLATKYPVVSSAQASEILNLNAYYYYKGGAVSSGPVKANTTFTFDYQ